MADHAGSEHATTEPHDAHSHAGAGMNLLAIGIALFVLTLASFVTLLLPGSIWSRSMNGTFVLLVALGKASLVVAFFMHYFWERPWKYVLTIPPLLLVVALFVSLLPDIGKPPYEPLNWGGQGRAAQPLTTPTSGK